MTNQRIHNIPLGYGTGTQTIANYGCFMISIYDALKKRNIYGDSVYEWNIYLRNIGVYTRENPILLSISTLAANSPFFTKGYRQAYSDAALIEYLDRPEKYIVIAEVSGKAIGGTGQHFVKALQADSAAGKVTQVYIDDPWGGIANEKITNRYRKYGNILSLRILELAKGVMPETTIPVEKATFERLVTKSTAYDEIVKVGYVPKPEHDNRIQQLQKEISESKYSQAQAEAALSGERASHQKTKELLTECQNKPIVAPVDPNLNGRLNGYTKTYQKNGVTVTENYTI